MTPVAWSYLAAGIAALVWPLLLFFGKRRVLGAQWLLMGASALLGLSEVLYSTFFNSFLHGEYLLVLLFMFASITTPLLALFALMLLVRRRGVTLRSRAVLLPALAVAVLIGGSVAVGGADMYRIWIANSFHGMAGHFFAGSWRYDVIVAVHYYGFTLLLLVELLLLVVNGIVSLARFRKIMSNYFTSNHQPTHQLRRIIASMSLISLVVGVDYGLHPFCGPREAWFAIGSSVAVGLLSLLYGHTVYRIDYGAEQIPSDTTARRINHDLKLIGREATRLIESDQAFLRPDLSVRSLALRLRVADDEIVDSLHLLHGTSFADLVDGLRIEYASHRILAAAQQEADRAAVLQGLALECGYPDMGALEAAFRRVMGRSIEDFTAASFS